MRAVNFLKTIAEWKFELRQNIFSGYLPERKNWEENDENNFKSIKCMWKKLCGVRAQNGPFLLDFAIFDRVTFIFILKFFYQLVRLILTDICANFHNFLRKVTWLINIRKTSKMGPKMGKNRVFRDFDRVTFLKITWNHFYRFYRSKIRKLGCILWLWGIEQKIPVSA